MAELVQLPGGPNPAEPVPRSAVAGFDLARYVGLAAELAENAEPRVAVLTRAGLDEMRWFEIEKTWLLRLATAALQGDIALLQEHEAALAAAQAERTAAKPLLSMEEYARIHAAIEGGADPSRALAAADLSPTSFARSHRAWTVKLASDTELAASFRAMVERFRCEGAGRVGE